MKQYERARAQHRLSAHTCQQGPDPRVSRAGRRWPWRRTAPSSCVAADPSPQSKLPLAHHESVPTSVSGLRRRSAAALHTPPRVGFGALAGKASGAQATSHWKRRVHAQPGTPAVLRLLEDDAALESLLQDSPVQCSDEAVLSLVQALAFTVLFDFGTHEEDIADVADRSDSSGEVDPVGVEVGMIRQARAGVELLTEAAEAQHGMVRGSCRACRDICVMMQRPMCAADRGDG